MLITYPVPSLLKSTHSHGIQGHSGHINTIRYPLNSPSFATETIFN